MDGIVYTTKGEYRLRYIGSGSAALIPALPDAWFPVRCAIEGRSPGALELGLRICSQLTGDRRFLTLRHPDPSQLRRVITKIECGLRIGWVVLEKVQPVNTSPLLATNMAAALSSPAKKKSPAPAKPKAKKVNWFAVKVVDEVNKPVDGLKMKLTLDGKAQNLSTNGVGVARVNSSKASSGTAEIVSVEEAKKKLEPLWKKERRGAAPQGENLTTFKLKDPAPSLSLVPNKEVTLCLMPNLDDLWVRLEIDPADAESYDDKFILTSTDGVYNISKTIKDDKIPDDDCVDLEYKRLDPEKSYSLQVVPGEGQPYYVFQNTPYDKLDDEDDIEDKDSDTEGGYTLGPDDPLPEEVSS